MLLFLVILFLLLVSLFLWTIIGSKGYWVLKVTTIVLSIFFSFFVYRSFKELTGWPTTDKLPAKFEIIWAKVYSPIGQEKGEIYLWSKDINHRLYKLPYSKEMHQNANLAIDLIKKGKRVQGIGVSSGTGKKGSKKGQLTRLDNPSSDAEGEGFTISIMPRPTLPPKE